MELQNFSSIFEIFATFTLAYIIIDELVENPFIRVISEKVLRIYKPIDDIFIEINGQIDGRKTSLNNIPLSDDQHEKIKEDLPRIKLILETIIDKNVQSFSEIRSIIKQKYATKVFVYLNCYLFLYCLSILFYGGLFKDGNELSSLQYNIRLDQSLALFNFCAIIFLLFGWFLDKPKIIERKNNFNQVVGSLLNGYLLSFCFYLISIALAVIAFHFNWKTLDFTKDHLHQMLIISCVFIPISNFLIYIFKARKRAKKSLPEPKLRANEFIAYYTNKLKKVDAFLGMCDHLRGGDLTITT